MYNTGNPVPSAALEDMADNAQTFDALVKKTEGTTTDRLGRTRRVFQQILMDMGFQPLSGSFQAGGTITARNQALYDEVSHVFYAWGGAIPTGGYVVAAGSTPATAGGVGVGAWSDKTDLMLRSELYSESGITMISHGVYAYYLVDAPDDGVADASTAISSAANTASGFGVPLILKKPSVSYLLNSDPAVPDNCQIDCNLSWFTGTGRLPVHKFVALSEGVDTRVFDSVSVKYTETEISESRRKWAIVGWVNYKNSPLYADTRTDAVGVDGRGVTSVPNGRVWGVLGLAQIDIGASGVAQALGGEIDVNQNLINNWEFDGPTPAKGLIVVSGGTKSPETGIMVQATRRPENDPAVDNRFYAAMRVYRDAYTAFGIHFDDTCSGIALRVPSTAVAMRATVGNQYNFDYRINNVTYRGELWCPLDKAIDVLYVDGSQIFSFDNNFNVSYRPIALKNKVTTVGTSINASLGNTITLTTSGTINSIYGGLDGQELTLINASAGTITVNQGANMRMSGWLFSMTPNSTITFVCSAPTWFEKCRSINS